MIYAKIIFCDHTNGGDFVDILKVLPTKRAVLTIAPVDIHIFKVPKVELNVIKE